METETTSLTTTEGRPATAKQRSYLGDRIATRPKWATSVGLAPEGIATLSLTEASQLIDSAQSIAPERKQHPDAIPVHELKEGGYWTIDGDVVRVRRSRRYDFYGQQFDPKTGRFEYRKGIVFRLKARMTPDEAKQWGAPFGRCCMCGKLLTDEKSMEQGIGPVCRRHL